MLHVSKNRFDYKSLPTEKSAAAQAAAERIRGRMQLAAESIIEVGRELIEQKKQLGHGNFLPWIEAEFGMSDDSAQKFMRIARELGSNAESSRYLSFEALAKLSSPSTPEPVREAVLERAGKGEKVTAREIEALKKKLAKAEEEAAEIASLASMREVRAREAEQQRDNAQAEAMFYKSDKDQLMRDLALANEEIERLKEPGVIHLLSDPVQRFNAEVVDVPTEDTPWTDDDAQFLLMQYAWEKASVKARNRFVEWAELEYAAA